MPDREAALRFFRHARREAAVVIVLWFLALVWTVGYCFVRGYDHAPDSWLVQSGLATAHPAEHFHPVAGFPDWVFYGILAPWLCCTLFTVAFAAFGMTDDPLGADAEEAGHGR